MSRVFRIAARVAGPLHGASSSELLSLLRGILEDHYGDVRKVTQDYTTSFYVADGEKVASFTVTPFSPLKKFKDPTVSVGFTWRGDDHSDRVKIQVDRGSIAFLRKLQRVSGELAEKGFYIVAEPNYVVRGKRRKRDKPTHYSHEREKVYSKGLTREGMEPYSADPTHWYYWGKHKPHSEDFTSVKEEYPLYLEALDRIVPHAREIGEDPHHNSKTKRSRSYDYAGEILRETLPDSPRLEKWLSRARKEIDRLFETEELA